MSSPAQPLLPLDPKQHYNSGLFADHYLNNPERLQALDEWQQAQGVDEALRQIAQLHAQKASYFTNHTNEAQTENDFIQSMANLTPLKGKRAATDRLIDLIMYRLYGLTEEEIAIVEAAASG